MNKLDGCMIHRIVGGLAPGMLPHEESVWCAVESLPPHERCALTVPDPPERPSAPIPGADKETPR